MVGQLPDKVAFAKKPKAPIYPAHNASTFFDFPHPLLDCNNSRLQTISLQGSRCAYKKFRRSAKASCAGGQGPTREVMQHSPAGRAGRLWAETRH